MRTLAFALLLLFVACNSTDRRNQSADKPIPSTDDLTKVSLPFSSSCGKSLTMYEEDSIKRIIKDLPDNLRFGGVLKTTKEYVAILLIDTYADYQIHYLTTITREGKIIDKFDLFSYGCAEDEFFWGRADYTITKELEILQSDSSATYKRTEAGDIIDSTIISSAHGFRYYVNKEGKVEKR